MKAYIGKPAGFHTFSDGVTFNTFDQPYIVMALASADGEPLVATGRIAPSYLVALNDAQNTGFEFNMQSISKPNAPHISPDAIARAITSLGRAPVVHAPAPCQVGWPARAFATANYDFALRQTSTAVFLNQPVTLPASPQPPWIILLRAFQENKDDKD